MYFHVYSERSGISYLQFQNKQGLSFHSILRVKEKTIEFSWKVKPDQEVELKLKYL
jgi:hypothetical protein